MTLRCGGVCDQESLNQQNILAFKSAQDQLEHAMLLPGRRGGQAG